MLNIVCWGTGHQWGLPLRGQSAADVRPAYRLWTRAYGRPRILVLDQQRSLATGEFPEAVEADGTRVEVTPAESPWRNGRTERAGGDWKATYHRIAEDTPEITTDAEFQEIRDAVNYARGVSDVPASASALVPGTLMAAFGIKK